jgi:hypothetical protein
VLTSVNSRKEDRSALCSNSSTACMSTRHCSHHMPQHRSMLATLSALQWMINRASQCSSGAPLVSALQQQRVLVCSSCHCSVVPRFQREVNSPFAYATVNRWRSVHSQLVACAWLVGCGRQDISCPPQKVVAQKVSKSPDRFMQVESVSPSGNSL